MIEVFANHAASHDHLQAIVNIIDGLKFIGRIAIDDPAFSAFADRLSTRIDGVYIHLKLHATEQQVSHMIRIAEERAE